jgi:hypothetical protein
MTRLLRWELAGTLFIILAGGPLHFAFELSGYARPMAIIAAVNESVWEHLKLAFWPGLAYALVAYPAWRGVTSNYWAARAVALWVMTTGIVLLFYAYTAILGHHELWLDGLIYLTAVGLGQLCSYRILSAPPLPALWQRLAWVALACLLAAFLLFSFFPPHLPLFRDSSSGLYGIPRRH